MLEKEPFILQQSQFRNIKEIIGKADLHVIVNDDTGFVYASDISPKNPDFYKPERLERARLPILAVRYGHKTFLTAVGVGFLCAAMADNDSSLD